MRTPRIYQSSLLKEGDTIVLDSQATTHVFRVLRLKLNDLVTVFNGNAGEFSGVITQVNKREVTVRLSQYLDPRRESPLHLTLLQGVSRGERMDYTLQKAVELGVNDIYPVITKHVSVQLNDERKSKKQKHWQGIVYSACEQSGRNYVPVVHPVDSLSSFLDKCPFENVDLSLVLNHRSAQTIAQLKNNKPARVLIAAGPEGGLSTDEIDAMEHKKFVSVSLGPRVLRTETAALAAIAVMQSLWGDFC